MEDASLYYTPSERPSTPQDSPAPRRTGQDGLQLGVGTIYYHPDMLSDYTT